MGLMSFLGLDDDKKQGTPINQKTLRAFKAHSGFLNNIVLI